MREVIEIVERAVGRPVAVASGTEQPGDVTRTEAVVERAARELGWTPRVQLADGLARHVAHLRRHRVASSAST
jgi:nucleoside-diphosphate-sugar epimerase